MHRLAFAAVAIVAAAAPALAAERRYTVTDFDRIQVDGPYRVTLTTGKAASARAEGPNQALDRLSVAVEGRTLRIRPNQSAWGGYPGEAQSGPVTIEVGTSGLRHAEVNGAGILRIGEAKAMRLDLSLAGSGVIEAEAVEADSLHLNLFGSGRINVAGKAMSVRAEAHGSGDLAAADLQAADAQVFADTAGTVQLRVSRSAKITSSATGDVDIAGKPSCTVQTLGTGRVRCGS